MGLRTLSRGYFQQPLWLTRSFLEKYSICWHIDSISSADEGAANAYVTRALIAVTAELTITISVEFVTFHKAIIDMRDQRQSGY